MDAMWPSLSHARLPSAFLQSPLKPSSLVPHNLNPCHTKSLSQVQRIRIVAKKQRSLNLGVVHASGSEPTSTEVEERWLLVPVGDGDSRHIGFPVKMPDAFEIASSSVTVGRVPDKADMVIPVATVSGVHARLEKREGSLLVIDLDSTNGTFVNEKRLRPGAAAAVPSGSCITFGDIHLARFRVSKIENVKTASTSQESEEQIQAEVGSNEKESQALSFV